MRNRTIAAGLLAAVGAAASGSHLARVQAESGRRLLLKRAAEEAPGGVFDPSFARDDKGRLWMSYSGVQPSPRFGEAFNSVSTRLAYSDDEGESWTDVGVVNAAGDQPLPWPHDKLYARWEQEVSRILFDPWSPAGSRWKLLWHRYLRVYDGKGADSVPLFEHGWIELRAAADPGGEWSAGRKLFVGRGYDRSNDRTIGPPEIRLHEVASGKDQLGRCLAFTEPGMVARAEGIYVVLKCATGTTDGQVALLTCRHDFQRCRYNGALLHDTDAARFGAGLSGFSGTDLAEDGGTLYLVATPTGPPAETYRGCLFFAVTSLQPARVDPAPALRVEGETGSFNGACAYAGAASKGGAFLSQLSSEGPDRFRIFATGRHLREGKDRPAPGERRH